MPHPQRPDSTPAMSQPLHSIGVVPPAVQSPRHAAGRGNFAAMGFASAGGSRLEERRREPEWLRKLFVESAPWHPTICQRGAGGSPNSAAPPRRRPIPANNACCAARAWEGATAAAAGGGSRRAAPASNGARCHWCGPTLCATRRRSRRSAPFWPAPPIVALGKGPCRRPLVRRQRGPPRCSRMALVGPNAPSVGSRRPPGVRWSTSPALPQRVLTSGRAWRYSGVRSDSLLGCAKGKARLGHGRGPHEKGEDARPRGGPCDSERPAPPTSVPPSRCAPLYLMPDRISHA